jgi:hypothetical protein
LAWSAWAAPPLTTRLIALAVIEVVLLVLVVLQYTVWAHFKNQPLDEWWARRKAAGLSPRSEFEMRESERRRQAAAVKAGEEAETPAREPAQGPPGG